MKFARKRTHLTLLLSLMLAGSATAGTLALFRTALGTIEVELYDAEKPITTGNFKRLVQAGAYENTFIHRLAPGFVAQGGSYLSLNPADTNLFATNWTGVGMVPHFGAISNEFAHGPLLSNTNGTIAMAKVAGNPDSATSGWFFNLVNNSSELDNQNGGFTVFGRVVRDTNNILPFLNTRAYNDGRVNMGAWYPADPIATNLFYTLPVLYSGPYHPRYADLVYVDISLLSLAIVHDSGLPQVSWNTMRGQTNALEFSESFPPNWQPLFSFVGSGNRVTIIDSSATGQSRFYRLRVVY